MKTITYKFKGFVIGLVAMISFGSCSDWLTLYPEGEIFLEDYWKTGTEVEAFLMSCYTQLVSNPSMQRMFVWGEVRSDNVVKGNLDETDALSEILKVNLMPTNEWCDWASFYTTINYCNTLLYYAPGVLEEDLNFSVNQMNAYRAEALAIRSLCFFYLVRAFGDVPLPTSPTFNDQVNNQLPRMAEVQVLDTLVRDLNEAKLYIPETYGSSLYTHDKGRFTKQSIRALLADIYLWKGDYQNCVNECNELLTNNELLNFKDPTRLAMIAGEYMFDEVFYRGNSTESILELQFSDENIAQPLKPLIAYAGSIAKLSLSNLYFGGSMDSPFLSEETDIRSLIAYPATVSSAGGSSEMMLNTKYVAALSRIRVSDAAASTPTTITATSASFRTNSFNWILYRLPDIYLMKAEALTELDAAANTKEVVRLVNQTYMRANYSLGRDSLKAANYASKKDLRELVLEERQREFIFEGKRWFDLLRMAKRDGNTEALVRYVERKFDYLGDGRALAVNKMSTMDAMYFPIFADEMVANKALVQNPFYQMDETSSVKQ